MYVASGLYYNFNKIVFSSGTNATVDNTGVYTEINGQMSGNLKSTAFIANGASGVHNLTLDELNNARNEKAGSAVYPLKSDKSSSRGDITTQNDAAKGLFYLKNLNKYGYKASTTEIYYWLASPRTSDAKLIWIINYSGEFGGNSSRNYGIRPVITLKNNIKLEVTGN